MLYVLAIFLPPVAVLLCGKPFQAILNIVLWACFWLPGSIHAWFVVSAREDRRRLEELAVLAGAGRRK